MAEQIAERRYSTVSREDGAAGSVYVKQYLAGDWGCTADVVRARAAREGEVIGRLGGLPGLCGRLGAMRLVSVDPEQATVVTAAVGGRPLDEYARDEYRRHFNGPCLRAFALAGRWLNVFQSLRVLPGDGERISENDPEDLVDYCLIRLRKIRSLGYRWLSEAIRSRVCEVVGELVERASQCDRRRVWAHHDYGPGNVMWDGRTLTAIDFAMASLDVPLVDVTYFIHRLEMMPIYFPWKRWPVAVWKRAFLRGYGRPDAEASPMYRALMIRHLLCRLQTYVRRPPKNLKQRVHNAWVRRCVRAKLIGMLD